MKSPARKAAAGVLAIVLLSLSGCGHSYESDSAAALEALAGAGSVHSEMSFRMAYTLSLEGETREFEITETCSLDSSAALTSGVLSAGEGGSELRYIVELNGDEYDLYLSRDGESWEARPGLDASELSGAGLVSDAAGPAASISSAPPASARRPRRRLTARPAAAMTASSPARRLPRRPAPRARALSSPRARRARTRPYPSGLRPKAACRGA